MSSQHGPEGPPDNTGNEGADTTNGVLTDRDIQGLNTLLEMMSIGLYTGDTEPDGNFTPLPPSPTDQPPTPWRVNPNDIRFKLFGNSPDQ